MSQQVFAQFIEMSPASLSSIFNGRTRPTLNIVEAIKKKIPNINTDWLMFGSGEMFTGRDSTPAIGKEEAEIGIEATLDFDDESCRYPADGSGGQLREWCKKYTSRNYP